MIISYEGTDYPFDQEDITVDEWRELKRKYQMTPRKFEAAIDEADPDAYTFLYWVLLRHGPGGTREPLGDQLKPDLLKLNKALSVATEAEAERLAAEQEADPTPGGSLPDGKTPGPAGSSTTTSARSVTTTSPPSPAISTSARGTSGG